MGNQENILVFGAHADDESIAMGGTIAKYSKEGKNIIVVIFSSGSASNPLLKEEVIADIREKEAKKIKKILGIKTFIFLGLNDQKLMKYVNDRQFIEKIRTILDDYKPTKIFTHARADPHRDHQAVNKIIMKATSHEKYHNYNVYTFDVWNPINIFNKRNVPKLIVDISETFDTKLKAITSFKSQKIQGAYSLLPTVIFKAKAEGIHNECKYAEKFFKVR
ncbi:MAG: PIG-L deacetylase family protein [Nanoarchaeota archaeon]